MGAFMLLASATLAFGPALGVMVKLISKRSHLVIIAITSGFFWLVSMLLSASLFTGFDQIEGFPGVISVLLAVGIQEVGRVAYVYTYTYAEHYAVDVTGITHLPFSEFSCAVAAGFGFGVIYAMVMYGNVLAAASEPADYYPPSCEGASIFGVSAGSALLMQVLHMCLSITMFDAWRRVKVDWKKVGVSVVIHFAATVSTYMNFLVSCALGTPLLVVVVFGAAVFAWRTVKSPTYAVYAMPAIKAASPSGETRSI